MQQFDIEDYTIQPHDTLQQVLQKFGLPMAVLAKWQKACRGYCDLGTVRPDDRLTLYMRRGDTQPVKFVYATVAGPTYTFRRRSQTWECQKDRVPSLSISETVRGTISDNLYDSCLRAGLPASQIVRLTHLFACSIDFMSDVRTGDSFAVHFASRVRKGQRVHVGPILGAEMVVGGRHFQAFYYALPDGTKGYFDAEGNSLQKLFLKAPLSYTRISSTFTYRRYHPILKIYRPHLGIDYAAPTGTPVCSLGSGTISYLGRRGGFGRFIAIRHNRHYRTTYGHLSRYARSLHCGSKVTRGQVIGYVGSSGLATGPHLDFRLYKNGRPINFLKTRFPHARSIPKRLRTDFQKKRQLYLTALQGRQFAANHASVAEQQ